MARRRSENGIVGVPRTQAQAQGEHAEQRAAAYLAGHGVTVIARNVRCRAGEVDLIGVDGDTLVFVEVRQRSDARFGGAAESITMRKQTRVIMAARWWLAGPGRPYAACNCRFDAILIEGGPDRPLRWIRAAFDTDGS